MYIAMYLATNNVQYPLLFIATIFVFNGIAVDLQVFFYHYVLQ